MIDPTLPIYDLTRPARWVGGLIVASPHSGRVYPDWFLESSVLGRRELRSSEDAFVDRLIAGAPRLGAVTLTARMPRCMVDLNRAPDEIDPAVVRGVPRHPLNQRTLAGLGVIPRVVAQGRLIHARPIDRREAERRIAAYWHPYHAALAALITDALDRFGQAVLIDMHSMPHDAVAHVKGPRPDIVLGNRHGLSASGAVTDIIAGAFEAQGWSLRRNSPFAGAHICAAYGRPSRQCHVVQIEIDRSIYMDEAALRPLDGFDAVAARIDDAIARIAGSGLAREDRAIAAE